MPAVAVRSMAPSAGSLVADRADVLRYLGYRPGKSELTPRVEAVVTAGIAGAINGATPRISLGYCSLATADSATVTLAVPGFSWHSDDLARRLEGAQAVSLLVATLGEGPSELVRQRFTAGDYAVATAIDAAATVLVQALLTWSMQTLAVEAAAYGFRLTPPFSPGYGDWEISDQRGLVAAVGVEAGVTCTPTCYLIPEKSIVAVVGWTAGASDLPSGCGACRQPACPYRQAPPRPVMKGDVQ